MTTLQLLLKYRHFSLKIIREMLEEENYDADKVAAIISCLTEKGDSIIKDNVTREEWTCLIRLAIKQDEEDDLLNTEKDALLGEDEND